MSEYAPVFQVEVGHEYFEPGSFAEHRLVPLPGTAAFLSRRGFRWVSEGSTHTLYADGALVGLAARSRPWLNFAPDTLCFGFQTDWRGFGWVTPLLDTAPGDIRVYTCALTPLDKGEIEAKGAAVAALRPPRFAIPAGTASRVSGQLRILDGSGRPVAAAIARTAAGWVVDLNSSGPGYYRVVRKGAPEQPVLVESTPGFSAPILALVVAGLPAKLEALARGRAPVPTVRLRFPSRATTWRYHVFHHDGASQAWRILPASGSAGGEGLAPPRFRRVPGRRGPGGDVSLSFESERGRPIPLRWRPRERFQLVGRDGVLMQPLPLPGPVLSPSSGARTHCSEMMVHL